MVESGRGSWGICWPFLGILGVSCDSFGGHATPKELGGILQIHTQSTQNIKGRKESTWRQKNLKKKFKSFENKKSRDF